MKLNLELESLLTCFRGQANNKQKPLATRHRHITQTGTRRIDYRDIKRTTKLNLEIKKTCYWLDMIVFLPYKFKVSNLLVKHLSIFIP